ncbi:MAG: hypothetical protein WD766_04590 [Gemmatimonadota bacterium]
MNTALAFPDLRGSGPMEVELLSEADLMSISGGGPLALGCLLLASAGGALTVGVVVGVVLYAMSRSAS